MLPMALDEVNAVILVSFFVDEETEAQRGQSTGSRLHSRAETCTSVWLTNPFSGHGLHSLTFSPFLWFPPRPFIPTVLVLSSGGEKQHRRPLLACPSCLGSSQCLLVISKLAPLWARNFEGQGATEGLTDWAGS